MEYDYFLKRDRLYSAIQMSIIIMLLLLSVYLLFEKHQVRYASEIDQMPPMTDEQFIAAGKRFLEYLYSLNAPSIEEDYFLLSQMIDDKALDKKEARQSWVEKTDIIRRVKRVGMKSRIDWDSSEFIIKKSAERAKVIQYQGIYEYKTENQDRYETKTFDLQIGLIQTSNTDMTPYGASVYNWIDYAKQ